MPLGLPSYLVDTDKLTRLLTGVNPPPSADVNAGQGIPFYGGSDAPIGMTPQPTAASYAQPNPPETFVAPAAPVINPSASTLGYDIPQPYTDDPQDIERQKQLEDAVTKDSKPLNPADKQYQPKWWERLAGAGVAGLMGANGDVQGGIKVGTDFQRRRFTNAETMRQKQLEADTNNRDSTRKYVDDKRRIGSQKFQEQMERVREKRAADETAQRDKNRIEDNERADRALTAQGKRDAERERADRAREKRNDERDAQAASDRADAASDRKEARKESTRLRRDSRAQLTVEKYRDDKAKIDAEKQREYDKIEGKYGKQREAYDGDTSKDADKARAAVDAEREQKKADIERSFKERYDRLGPEPSMPKDEDEDEPGNSKVGSGKPLDQATARSILNEAKGDKQKAIKLAQQRGFDPYKRK